MNTVELISLKNSSFDISLKKEVKIWASIREDLLLSFSKPFILFLDYALLKKNFAKFNEIGKNKNLISVVLSVNNEVFTYTWKELESELKRSALKKIQTFDNTDAIQRIMHSWEIEAQYLLAHFICSLS